MNSFLSHARNLQQLPFTSYFLFFLFLLANFLPHWFQTIDLILRAYLALTNFKSALFMLEQKQNLFMKAYCDDFLIGGVLKEDFTFTYT